jgi:hypothetical protein
MKKKLIILAVIAILSTAMYIVSGYPKTNTAGCTMEAKICPDGSAVGRSGPSCEFSPCPTTKPKQIITPSLIPTNNNKK